MLKIHLEIQMFQKFGWGIQCTCQALKIDWTGKFGVQVLIWYEITQYTRAQPELARPAPPPLSCNKYIVKSTSEHVPCCQLQPPQPSGYSIQRDEKHWRKVRRKY